MTYDDVGRKAFSYVDSSVRGVLFPILALVTIRDEYGGTHYEENGKEIQSSSFFYSCLLLHLMGQTHVTKSTRVIITNGVLLLLLLYTRSMNLSV